MNKIKKDYPRLPICMQRDALYATESMMWLYREEYRCGSIFLCRNISHREHMSDTKGKTRNAILISEQSGIEREKSRENDAGKERLIENRE